jgi:hypothetical protein
LPRRQVRRWNTQFGRWVGSYGVTRLCEALSRAGQPVTPHAVYGWVGGRIAPRPQRAIAIARLSGGALGVGEIYGQRSLKRTRPSVPLQAPTFRLVRQS